MLFMGRSRVHFCCDICARLKLLFVIVGGFVHGMASLSEFPDGFWVIFGRGFLWVHVIIFLPSRLPSLS